jgi:hypothetical protein
MAQKLAIMSIDNPQEYERVMTTTAHNPKVLEDLQRLQALVPREAKTALRRNPFKE